MELGKWTSAIGLGWLRGEMKMINTLKINLHFASIHAAYLLLSSVQFSRSVVSDSLRLMNRSMPGLPVHHQLPEFTQTHARRVGDAILLSPFPPAFNLSQQHLTNVPLLILNPATSGLFLF